MKDGMKEIGFDCTSTALAKHFRRFPKTNILVVGDIIMDEFIWGDVSRISPEAPVPVVDVREETKMLGGAANVVNNISSLGGRSILCGVVGDDSTGKELVERIKGMGLPTSGILVDPGRPTTIKTRIVAQSQQVVRFDRESRKEIHPAIMERLLGFSKEMIPEVDAVIVADYAKGVVCRRLVNGLRRRVKGTKTILAVDPKIGHFQYYEGVHLITPNHHEAGAFAGVEIADEKSLVMAGDRLLHDLRCRSVLITQGKDGMTLFEENGEISHIPTVARKVFDVTGAGDTVISTICVALAAGMDLKSAAMVSNFAAGVVVGEVGTSTVKAEDLEETIRVRLGRARG